MIGELLPLLAIWGLGIIMGIELKMMVEHYRRLKRLRRA